MKYNELQISANKDRKRVGRGISAGGVVVRRVESRCQPARGQSSSPGLTMSPGGISRAGSHHFASFTPTR